jgi:hypothetical protein
MLPTAYIFRVDVSNVPRQEERGQLSLPEYLTRAFSLSLGSEHGGIKRYSMFNPWKTDMGHPRPNVAKYK